MRKVQRLIEEQERDMALVYATLKVTQHAA